MVVLKLLSASPEVYPTPVPGWIIVRLCTPNKVNLKFRKNKVLASPEIDEGWIYCRSATRFTVLLKKLQHIRGTNKGFLYNSPSNIYIFTEGNCTPRYDALNKISAGISLITSCRIPGSHLIHVHLCGLIHQEKTAGCCICPLQSFDGSVLDPPLKDILLAAKATIIATINRQTIRLQKKQTALSKSRC